MTKTKAMQHAQKCADLYNRDWTVLKCAGSAGGFATEPLNKHIPQNEIFLIVHPNKAEEK